MRKFPEDLMIRRFSVLQDLHYHRDRAGQRIGERQQLA